MFGTRVLVTRPEPQAAEFSDLIHAQGGEAVECPTIEVTPPKTGPRGCRACAPVDREWLIFTSVNGVAPFMTRLFETKRDVRALAGMTICCIGPRTADALAAFGLRADVIPEQFQREGSDALALAGRFAELTS